MGHQVIPLAVVAAGILEGIVGLRGREGRGRLHRSDLKQRGPIAAIVVANGPMKSPPPFAAAEPHYAFKYSGSYDGQWYHLMAHDPFMSRGAASVIDAPVLRYRRILVSLLA